jgi:hypothetical protein
MPHSYRTGEDGAVNIDSLGTPDAPTFGLDTFGDLERDPAAGPDEPLAGARKRSVRWLPGRPSAATGS